MVYDYYAWLNTMRGGPDPKPEPVEPDPRGDPPHFARCEWGPKGHGPILPVWQVPRDGHWYCAEHLLRILRIAWWKP